MYVKKQRVRVVIQKFCRNPAEEFCYFDGRSGLPTLCISAMILVALQNNS